MLIRANFSGEHEEVFDTSKSGDASGLESLIYLVQECSDDCTLDDIQTQFLNADFLSIQDMALYRESDADVVISTVQDGTDFHFPTEESVCFTYIDEYESFFALPVGQDKEEVIDKLLLSLLVDLNSIGWDQELCDRVRYIVTKLEKNQPYKMPEAQAYVFYKRLLQVVHQKQLAEKTPKAVELLKTKQVELKAKIKSSKPYLENSAILQATNLFKQIDVEIEENIDSKTPLFQSTSAIKQTFNLEDIAEKARASLGEKSSGPARKLKFIAIGIREDGNHVVTTNYHAPVVFRLYDILETPEHYTKNIKPLRDSYKNQHNAYLTFGGSSMIHAESMLAALKEPLKISDIIIIDGNGKLNRNCVFCAKFLQERGFKMKSHFEGIRNYNMPSAQQIKASGDWFLWLSAQQTDATQYQYIGPQQKRVPQRSQELRQEQVNQVINHYPDEPERSDIKTKQTYCSAKGLANSQCVHFNRVTNHKGKSHKKNIHNLRVCVKRDGRIKSSKKNPGNLSPESPGSPRSSQLCETVNFWGETGNTHSLNTTDKGFIVDRTTPINKENTQVDTLIKELKKLKL